MKYGSYESMGYKYGLICNPNTAPEKLMQVLNALVKDEGNIPQRKDTEKSVIIEPEMIVPYESVDGLSLAEISDYKNLLYYYRYLVFVMYDSISSCERKYTYYPEFSEKKENARARYICVIDTLRYSEYTIDEVLEKHLVESLDQLNLQNRKRALCFLERYVCDKMIDVNNVIRKYLYENKSEQHLLTYTKLNTRLIQK